MVRIEYEYPLFKVYYSNNSNNSNIRGNPAPVSFPFIRSGESQTVVECGFGDNYVNRVVTEDEEDEREDVASVWTYQYILQ